MYIIVHQHFASNVFKSHVIDGEPIPINRPQEHFYNIGNIVKGVKVDINLLSQATEDNKKMYMSFCYIVLLNLFCISMKTSTFLLLKIKYTTNKKSQITTQAL